MRSTPAELAAWMRSEREARGWSTTELADRARAFAQEAGAPMKLSQQSISSFEQGGAKREPAWFPYVRRALGNEEPAEIVKIWDRIAPEKRPLAQAVLEQFIEKRS